MKLKRNKVVVLYYMALMLFTGLVGYISLGRGFDFDIMSSLEADGFSIYAFVKGIQENGISGAWLNNRIGAPGRAVLLDFPGVGNIDIIIMWIISWFTDSFTQIVYVFLILSYVFDGIAMSLLMRKLRFNTEVSFVFSCLFSFAPYHFYRYLGHLSLILYISIPIALYLGGYIIGIVHEDKKWKLIVSSILLGMGYGYYYAFGLIVLAVAYLIKFIKLEKKREILKELWIGAAVLSAVFVGMLPQFVYTLMYGPNLEVGKRTFFESENYGLKIINLLLPVSYSRLEPLRNLTESYISSGAPLVTENEYASLGTIGSIGFIILCIALIISFVKKEKCSSDRWNLVDYLSILTLTFVLISAIGGFGEIFNWAVTSQIRCYNRSSILLTCTSLLMIALLVNMIGDRSRRICVIACILTLIVGMYDQVNVLPAHWQDGIRETQEMYEVYFDKVEDALDENDMVYQLPYMEYPENGPVNNMADYKQFTGYVFTDTLKWSYGAVRGRNEYARELYIDGGMSYRFLAAVKEAGFSAVYIDLDGYEDGGEQILGFYNELGILPVVSDNSKLYLYDISELSIPQNAVKPGYTFVKRWADKFHDEVVSEEIDYITDGLNSMDMSAYLILYDWFSADQSVLQCSDQEYIDSMYYEVLNRGESAEERDSWIEQLQNGISREEVFYAFLNSTEFREGNGLKTED